MDAVKDLLEIINVVEKTSQNNNQYNKQASEYNNAKKLYYQKLYKAKFDRFLGFLSELIKEGFEREKIIEIKKSLEQSYSKNNFSNIKSILLDNALLFKERGNKGFVSNLISKIRKAKLPNEIREEIFLDLQEIDNCYKAKAYRSVIILCARILEILLHRKYFESTGIDLLEKNPGIGLGNLIAKLKERGIEFDPALTQQIHLINQIRIVAVHKKNYIFSPSREQTQAIVLYTIDLIQKLF